MKITLLFLLVAAAGNVIYHIGQKLIPVTGNPMGLLAAVYAAAMLLSLLAMPLFPGARGVAWAGLILDWRIWLLALGCLVIEIGFLLAYRAGGSLQWSGVAVNGVAALLLIPVAILFFREPLSAGRVLGIATTLAGLFILSRSA